MSLLDIELTRGGGVIRCRDHPHLRSAISRAVQRGDLVKPVPGVVAFSTLAEDPLVRVRVAALWRPSDPICLDAAAHLTITRRATLPEIVLAGPSARRHPGFVVQHRDVPEEWLMHYSGVLLTSPPLTVADQLCRGHASDLYDALRRRLVSLESVRAALDSTAHRRGAKAARRQLWLARENPWSDGEALLHSTLRSRGLWGWKGNVRIVAFGNTYFGDVVFRRRRLIVELDGREHHTSESDQRADRARRNALTAAGWRVLVITMDLLAGAPDDTVALVHRALDRASKSP